MAGVIKNMNLFSNCDFKNCKNFISNKKFDKVFIITGQNSFYKSGLKSVIENLPQQTDTYTGDIALAKPILCF